MSSMLRVMRILEKHLHQLHQFRGSNKDPPIKLPNLQPMFRVCECIWMNDSTELMKLLPPFWLVWDLLNDHFSFYWDTS